MCVVFIEPLSTNIGMFVPAYPLACLEIAGFARASWPLADVHVISMPLDYGIALTPEGRQEVCDRLLKDLAALRPRGVGISCSAIAQAEQALALAVRIKAEMPDVFIFLGGYFATHYAANVLALCPAVDGVVCGEGEQAAADIVGCIGAGKDPRQAAVTNLALRAGDRIVRPAKQRRFDLRDKAPLDPGLMLHASPCHVLPYAFSRGCPFRCHFCMETRIRPQRRQVPEDLVWADLDRLLKALPVRTVLAADALFQSFHLLAGLRDRGVNLHFETRCDAMDPGLLDAGADVCGLMALGLESASVATLRRMNKVKNGAHGRRYLDGAEALFARAAANGVPVAVFMIAGYPGDTAADLEQSLDFAGRLAARAGPGPFG